ncbi:hypothetical protein N0V83_002059 [Neocucurbitaria cava]|uniref:Uncharacterized protein n=1 Tax=Neocucurbitaria cava TaxID=798079 RepID=A0A9W8YDE1_9PLEO|nr:hypothetical protein N0V83_002059 [Neocucurbitaria cava]
MASLLDEFFHLMLVSQPGLGDVRETNKAKAAVMWNILEFGVSRSHAPGRGLFHPTFFQEQELQTSKRRDDLTFDKPDHDASDIQDIVSHYAAPPDRFLLPTADRYDHRASPQQTEAYPKIQDTPQQASLLNTGITNFPPLLDWTWMTENSQGSYDPNIMLQEQGGMGLDWWDNGIL